MLGIVPGTNIQIDFTDWLIGAALLGMGAALWVAVRSHALRRMSAAVLSSGQAGSQGDRVAAAQ